ncbi:MAG: hypothetical protein IH623_18160 [Verrucomicrobia bacterium]|nr:hypothetical protein [Verrucomicrobiota bacterium]
MNKLSLLAAGLLSTSLASATVQSPIDCHILFDGSNTVQILWNAYPGKSYVLHTTSNLLGDWSSSAPLVASSISLRHTAGYGADPILQSSPVRHRRAGGEERRLVAGLNCGKRFIAL